MNTNILVNNSTRTAGLLLIIISLLLPSLSPPLQTRSFHCLSVPFPWKTTQYNNLINRYKCTSIHIIIIITIMTITTI